MRLARELDVKVAFEPVQHLPGPEMQNAPDLFFSGSEEERRKFAALIDRLIAMKNDGYPIIHSKTYLKRLRSGNKKIRCRINQSILAVGPSGDLYNCRVHDEPLGNILETSLKDVWERSAGRRKEIRGNCDGCLFFGYMENNLLLNYNIESLFGYEWMRSSFRKAS